MNYRTKETKHSLQMFLMSFLESPTDPLIQQLEDLLVRYQTDFILDAWDQQTSERASAS